MMNVLRQRVGILSRTYYCALATKKLSTKFDCSLFTRLDGSQLYPGPQAKLRDRPFLAGSTSETFPEHLNGPRDDFPIFLKANATESLTPLEWATVCREKLDEIMPEYSAVAFRGLQIDSPESFNEFCDGCGYGILDYVGGAGVRNKAGPRIYNSSLEPPEYNIELHNELSYTPIYNQKITMFCLEAPDPGAGGISAICNNRDVFKMMNPVFVQKLREKGLLYIRNTENSTVPGMESWQNTFETTSKEEVEKAMSLRGFTWEWQAGDRLRYWQKLDAFTLHPETGEELWFNHVCAHHATFYKSHPRFHARQMSDDEYPMHCTYGDGEEMEPEYLQQAREAAWKHAVGFPWQKGDVLVLDNMVAKHSRLSFTGKRRILVGLSAARKGQAYHGHREHARL